jgi:hypothetical protein
MASPDQVLALHRVHDNHVGRLYELTGLRTASIRDQMLRAQLLVERLAGNGPPATIRPQEPGAAPQLDADLLVIGGGAAGVNAALTALALGIDVMLIEREEAPFVTQKGVNTRWIDPAEYDFPQRHFRDGAYPYKFGPRAFALPFRAGWASDLADSWQRALDAIIGAGLPDMGTLTQVLKTAVVGGAPSIRVHPTHVELGPLAGQPARHFGAAVSCVGIGEERVNVPANTGLGDYRGFEFWGNDPYAKPGLGLGSSTTGAVRALISGGGDGAQQDFQRLLTGNCGLALFDRFGALLPSNPGFVQSLADLAAADDQGRRAHAWSPSGETAAAALERWHEAYVLAADRIWTSWTSSQRSKAQKAVLRTDVEIEATWLTNDDYAGFSYPLNRLLTLLVARLHASATSRPLVANTPRDRFHVHARPVLCSGLRIDHVVPTGHSCSDPNVCHGKVHRVHVNDLLAPVATPPQPLGNFEVLVIRHGLDPAQLFGNAQVPEQTVPFALP